MPKRRSAKKRAPSAKAAQTALKKLQAEAKKNGLDRLTDKEIDDIIDDTRRQMKTKEKPMKRAPKKAPKKRKTP